MTIYKCSLHLGVLVRARCSWKNQCPGQGVCVVGGTQLQRYVILSLFLFPISRACLNNINAKTAKKILTIITQILTTLAGLFLPCSDMTQDSWEKLYRQVIYLFILFPSLSLHLPLPSPASLPPLSFPTYLSFIYNQPSPSPLSCIF